MSAAVQLIHGKHSKADAIAEIAKEIRARSDDAIAMRQLADELDGLQAQKEDEMREKQRDAGGAAQSAETGAAHQAAWSGGAKVMAGDTKSEVDAGDSYPGEGERKNVHTEPAGGKDNNGKGKSSK